MNYEEELNDVNSFCLTCLQWNIQYLKKYHILRTNVLHICIVNCEVLKANSFFTNMPEITNNYYNEYITSYIFSAIFTD